MSLGGFCVVALVGGEDDGAESRVVGVRPSYASRAAARGGRGRAMSAIRAAAYVEVCTAHCGSTKHRA